MIGGVFLSTTAMLSNELMLWSRAMLPVCLFRAYCETGSRERRKRKGRGRAKARKESAEGRGSEISGTIPKHPTFPLGRFFQLSDTGLSIIPSLNF